MSIWKDGHVLERVVESLRNLNAVDNNYVTAYQLAIQFAKDHGEVVDKLDLPIGGKGTGEHKSLASYLAQNISSNIKLGDIENIDIAFLSTTWVKNMEFKDDVGKDFSASDMSAISMFRLRE